MIRRLPDCHMQEESRFGDPLSLFLHKLGTPHEIRDPCISTVCATVPPYHNNSALSLHAPMFLLLVFTTINYLVTFSVPVCMAAWLRIYVHRMGSPAISMLTTESQAV